MVMPQRDASRQQRVRHNERKLSRSMLNDILAKVVQVIRGVDGVLVRQAGTGIAIGLRRHGRGTHTPPVTFLAALMNSTPQSGHEARWNYTFGEVALSDAGYDLVDNGRTGTAINLIELAHIAEPAADQPWYVWGVDVHSDDYPDGFGVRPIGGGGTTGTNRVDVVVELTTRTNSDGTTVYTFEGLGSHDGTCAA